MTNFLKQFFDIKFWKFIIVGLINTLAGNGLQFVFFNATPLKTMDQAGVFIASTISYILASVLSYFLNKYFTFKNTEKGIKPILRFAINIAVCFTIAYGIAVPIVTNLCTIETYTIFGFTIKNFPQNLSMIIGSCLFVACNYIGQRFFAFKEN